MTEKEFYNRTKKKPSIDAQSALDILTEHFLGNMSIKSYLTNDERNWLIVNLILKKYKFVNIRGRIKQQIKNISSTDILVFGVIAFMIIVIIFITWAIIDNYT